MKLRRGLTLPELLVAMGLTGLVLSLVYPVLYGTMRAIHRADADTQSQQKAVLLVEKFFADFASTSRSSLTVIESLPAASFLSQSPMTVASLPNLQANTDYFPSGANSHPIVWTKFVAMAFDAPRSQLQRMEFPYSGGSFLACIKPDQLTRLLSDNRYQASRRLVVSDIQALKIRASGDASINLEVTSKVRADVEKTTRLQVTLTMRN